MTKIDDMFNGHKEFYKKYFIDSPEIYKDLYENGQFPKTLIIACSDSRVDPATIFNTKPGEIFVVRNVANLVPPYEEDCSTCHGTSAAIEYAVNHLEVENIIVLGHSDCGGIKTILNKHAPDTNFINHWLDIAKDIIPHHKNVDKKYCTTCEKEAIKISISNLATFPFIKARIENKKIELHGLHFCLKSGSLEKVCKLG